MPSQRVLGVFLEEVISNIEVKSVGGFYDFFFLANS